MRKSDRGANERFRMLFDSASVGIIAVGADGRAVEANPAIERMLGYHSGELTNLSFTALRCRVSVWRDAGAADSSQVAIAMIEDITQAKLAGIAVQEKASRLERIIATQRDIAAAASGDLDHVMRVIVERAQALTRAEGTMVSLIDGDDVVTRAACGIAERFLHDRRPMSETVSRFAIWARRPVPIEHAEDDQRLNHQLRALVGDRSHICVPLFAGDEPVGAVSVMSTSAHERLNEEDRQTLELLAGVLSEGVSRAAESEARRQQVDANPAMVRSSDSTPPSRSIPCSPATSTRGTSSANSVARSPRATT